MKKNIVQFFFFFLILSGSQLYGVNQIDNELKPDNLVQQDTLKENQILFNGRIWKNLYYMVEEDQFLFSRMFLPGSVTIRGKTFENIGIMYDLYKDEILTPVSTGVILQLNKEMVDSFSVRFQNKTHRFARMPDDSLEGLKGYVNVLYRGKTALYIKYNKKINRPKVEGESDAFYQIARIYFVKDSKEYLITGKKDIVKVLDDDKEQVTEFIKKNNLSVSKNEPESFIPVIRYYDQISK
jgi:hypothetical protein